MKAAFFANNRAALAAKLEGGLVVLTAYTAMQRSADTAATFEQEANFWYLTGIEHADWQIIIDTTTGKEWLVRPDVEEAHELFDGSLSPEEGSMISGVKNIISVTDRDVLLRELTRKHSVVYTVEQPSYVKRANFSPNPALTANIRHLKTIFNAVQACNKELAQLRSIKQSEEISAMQRAIKLTLQAFGQVKKDLAKFKYEYEVEAEFSYYFRSRGAKGHAYEPIIATGSNACTLHYIENNALLKKRQLLLMDVGARIDGYAADITRTYALGEPTRRQKELHQALQAAHQDIIRYIKPGLLVEEYSELVDERMKMMLTDVGLLKSVTDTEAYRRYFPHAISHGLGIDVHDSLGGPKAFEEGMVLTVEPGVYIPEEKIGTRIEDDILVTEKGYKNLSASLSTEL